MSKHVSRRTFMKQVTAAGIGVPLILPRLSLAAPANSKLQHAAIGVSGQGRHDLEQIFKCGKVDVVALCDIDATALERASQVYPNARLYRDWREMLEEEENNIDSVNVSTPDHTHAAATYSAIKKGKHAFCEKPLTHEVFEARKVTEIAAKMGVATQMGNQIHSHDYYRTAVRWVQEGAIGKVKEWHSWSAAIYTRDLKTRPEGSDPIPDTVDWELWLGTAPERPYKTELYHPFWWRCYRDFGGGATGDFGCHIFDPVFTAMKIGDPLSVTCTEVEGVSDEVWPGWVVSEYVFPGTEYTAGKTINGSWRDGGKKPDVSVSPHLPSGYEFPKSGSVLIGEEGTLVIPHVNEPKLYPEEKFVNYPLPELEPLDHYEDFVDAAMGNGVAGSNFAYAGPLTEAVLLTNIANRFPGETLEWNAEKLKFTNNRDANKLLKRKYRRGYRVRGL